MAWYRLYFMDAFSSHIHSFHEFEAENDVVAQAIAQEWRGQSHTELWCRHRKVMSWPENFGMPDDKAAE